MSTYERDKLNVNDDTVNLRDAGSVRFDRAQSLTAAQQAQARDNIGAGTGAGGVTGVKGGAENDYRTGQVNLTPANIGLGNVDNTSDADKPVSTAQQAALNGKVDKVTGKGLSTNDYTDADKAALAGKLDASQKGAASGVAELDSGGKVPSSQLPSYVDDVVEYASASAFPATGEAGKIYVDTTDNKTYRWSSSGYVEISPSLALGETSSTAYRGDRGKAAYDHAAAKGSAFASGLYKIATNAEGHVTAAAAAEKADITALGIPGQDTTYQDATQSAAGLMSATDKAKLDGIAAGAQVNSVTGVKGNEESDYRTGQVNITPANIGAVSKAGDTMTGPLTVPQIYSANAAYPAYLFANAQNAQVADIYYDIGSKNMVFRYTSDNQEEHYVLPNLTGSGGHYILTSKFAVTVPQGGTGATDAATARANLGITPANIGAVSKAGDTMTGPLILDNAYEGGRAIHFYANGTEIGWLSIEDQTNVMRFVLYNPNVAGAYSIFQFPAPDDNPYGLYEILTTKSPVNVPQGGTGATTPAGARENIGSGCPSGTFTTADGKTVTVTNGFITAITQTT